jgi:hypothetical protein
LKADGVLLFVSRPNEGVHLAVCLLPEETKLDIRDGILEAWDRDLIDMAASARGTFVGVPWEQGARWSNRPDSRPANLEVDNNIELWLVGVTSTGDDALLLMVVDECKMWKLAGAKACKSLEILLLSE